MPALVTTKDISTGKVSREEFRDFIRKILPKVDQLSTQQIADLHRTIAEINRLDMIEDARTQFIPFVKLIMPPFKFSSRGQHHMMAKAFERLVDGDLKRLTVSMAPRYGKSTLGSILLPAWFFGKYPEKKVIQASADDELASGFGVQLKSIIESPIYQEIFPGIKLSKDSRSATRFTIDGYGGTYYALGVNSGVAGRGADLFSCDDLLTEQDIKTGSLKVFESVFNWLQTGPLQRLQPGGRILLTMTRWSKADPIGKLQKRMREDSKADRYESIEFPALDDNGESTFPELWSTEEMVQKKNQISPIFWNAQFQQNPTAVETSIIKKTWWKVWDKLNADGDFVTPYCHYTIMVWDTAYTANKRSNPSACTIWGVFRHQDDLTEKPENNIILLHSYKKIMEFGTLKVEAKRLIDEWKPDSVLIEAKSSGPMLRSELMEAGIYVEPVSPKPNEDKTSRLNSVSDVFMSGKVWYIPTRDNEETVQEVADFPAGETDDLSDTVAYAIRRFRSGALVSTANDRPSDPDVPRKTRAYY